MSAFYPHFVIVVHPTATRPDTIFEALSANKAVALNILTYAQWLKQDYIPEHSVLCIRDNGDWEYAATNREKEKVKKAVQSEISRHFSQGARQ